MLIIVWLYYQLLAVWAALKQRAADGAPQVRAWLKDAYRMTFVDVNPVAAHVLSHGWFEAGMTVMVVAPQWECYLLVRLGCEGWVWAWLLLYAVLFAATLPISKWWRAPATLVLVWVLWCCDAPWHWHVLVLLGNVKVSSFVLGERLNLLMWEARTIARSWYPRFIVSQEWQQGFAAFKQAAVSENLYKTKLTRTVPIFAKMLQEFDVDRARNPRSFAWTKLLCFRHVFIPLLLMRAGVIGVLELVCQAIWYAVPLVLRAVGSKATVAGALAVLRGRALSAYVALDAEGAKALADYKALLSEI
jgi:hypothetical protein